jgi:hypothetical protein
LLSVIPSLPSLSPSRDLFVQLFVCSLSQDFFISLLKHSLVLSAFSPFLHLLQVKLTEYEQRFAQKNIDGRQLQSMNRKGLQALGIQNADHLDMIEVGGRNAQSDDTRRKRVSYFFLFLLLFFHLRKACVPSADMRADSKHALEGDFARRCASAPSKDMISNIDMLTVTTKSVFSSLIVSLFVSFWFFRFFVLLFLCFFVSLFLGAFGPISKSISILLCCPIDGEF